MKRSIANLPRLHVFSSAFLIPCLGFVLSEDIIPNTQTRTAKSWWAETMEIPEAKWIVWTLIVVVSIIVAFYCAKLFRDMAFGRSGSSDFMNDFGKLRDEGALDETEYAQLKKAMANRQMEKAGIKIQSEKTNPELAHPDLPPKTSSKPKTLAEMKELEEARKAAQTNNQTDSEDSSQE